MKGLTHLLIAALFALSACADERASEEQCRVIFDRLVELELHAMGFEDPALEARRKAEFSVRYRRALGSCVGRRISPDAMECVATAKTTETVSHECLH